MKEFDYPLDYELYSLEEITTIITFLDIIEECYTKGVTREEFKKAYSDFKQIIKTKSEENNLIKNFKKLTGFDGYLCNKAFKKEVAIIKL